MTSLFILSTDTGLDLLEELEIKGCQALEYKIKEESGRGKEKEIVKDDDIERKYSPSFQKMRRLVINSCLQLEQISVGSNKRQLMKHTPSLVHLSDLTNFIYKLFFNFIFFVQYIEHIA